MNPRTLPGVGLDPPLPRHVLVVLAGLAATAAAAAPVGAVVPGEVVGRLVPGQVLHLQARVMVVVVVVVTSGASRGQLAQGGVSALVVGDGLKSRVRDAEREPRKGRRGEPRPTVRVKVEPGQETGGRGETGGEERVVGGPTEGQPAPAPAAAAASRNRGILPLA